MKHDANGVPMWFELPPGVQQSFDRKLARCQRAWRAGEKLAVAEALTLTFFYRQTIAPWLEEAAISVLVARRTKADVKQYRQRMIDYARWAEVECFHRPTNQGGGGLTWVAAYGAAAKRLAGTAAQGGPDCMAKSYKTVARARREKRGARYFMLKDKRYRGLDWGNPRA
jgi:hypothetical protein